MSVQYLLVTFPEQRGVLADGVNVGPTNQILVLQADEYQISLSGTGYAPASQDVPLNGSSLAKPMVIAFTATAAVGQVSGDLAAAQPAAKRKRAPAERTKKPLDDDHKPKKTTPRARKTPPAKTAAKPSTTRGKGKKNA